MSIKNFKSFKDSTSLSMIPSSRVKEKSEEKIKISDNLRLLRSAVVFGPNASGKSNVIDAFNFLKFCVTESLPSIASNFSYRGQEPEINSEFSVRIHVNGKNYEYGFEVNLSRLSYIKEWIYELNTSKKPLLLFERNIEKEEFVYDKNSIVKMDSERLEIYAADIKGSNSRLMIKEMNSYKTISKNSKLNFFKDIYDWFDNHLHVVGPSTTISDFRTYFGENNKRIMRLIKLFDTGINEIQQKKVSIDEFYDLIGKERAENLFDELIERTNENEDKIHGCSIRTDNFFLEVFYLAEEHDFRITTMSIFHNGIEKPFGFIEESDGTKRIFDLLDLLVSDKECVYVIDELDRSLHPVLVNHFVEQFNKMKKGCKAQLIITTHQPILMDNQLFRKDEIWFVDKNMEGVSKLYSLDMFNLRTDLKKSKSYLEGRYGALPVLQDIIDKEGC